MTWMLTANGASIDLRFMREADISIADIAHHLAQLNRFTGACARPYSVAEHSLLVCEILEREHGVRDPAVLMAGLLHDAHEAYTADLSSPMKQLLGAEWARVEDRAAHIVRGRFHVVTASHAHHAMLRAADLTALSTERAQLMPPEGPPWAVSQSHPPVGWWTADFGAAFTWQDWRQAFIDRFDALEYARSALHSAARESAPERES